MDLSAEKFNQAAEKYYRTDLRKQHIGESFDLLGEDIKQTGKMDQMVNRQNIRSLLAWHLAGNAGR